MIVAIGKLGLFQQVWRQVSAVAEKKGIGAEKENELRRHVKMAVDSLDDAIFFIEPAPGKTQSVIEKELKAKLERANIQEQIMENLTKGLASETDLRAFLPGGED